MIKATCLVCQAEWQQHEDRLPKCPRCPAEVFTDEDLFKSKSYDTLGPAYFAARRAAEALMQGVESEPLKKVVDDALGKLRDGLYAYVEDYMRSDMEQNLQGYVQEMVERTVRALLTGEPWALKQYPMAQYHDGEKIREAVARHGGDPLLMARISDLEKEVARLTETLSFYRR